MGEHGQHRPLVRAFAPLLLAAGPVSAEPAVITSLAADLNGDTRPELAVLIGESDVALAIFGQDEDFGPVRLLAESPAIAWIGSRHEPPRLDATAAGSLQVTSSNWGVGRHKWEMTVTVAYRDDAFRIAGVTFAEVDTLVENSARQCDVNLLSGRGVISAGGEDDTQTQISAGLPAVAIEAWTPDSIARACGPDW